MQKRYPEGETHCDAVAAQTRAATTAAALTLIEAHAWAKTDSDDRGPGKLIAAIGTQIRDWGHPILAEWMDRELVPLVLAPPDAAAFAAWQAETAADSAVDSILAGTAEGLVAHGAPLATGEPPTRVVGGYYLR